MRRRRWRWACWLCPAHGVDDDGLTAFEEFEAHYREKHREDR